MSEIQAIVTAILGASSLLAYMAFKLNDSESEILQVLGTFFFTVSLSFVIGLVWIAQQIAENTVPIDAYIGTAFVPLINVVMWVFIITVLILFFRTLYSGLKVLMDVLSDTTMVKRLRRTQRGGRVQ